LKITVFETCLSTGTLYSLPDYCGEQYLAKTPSDQVSSENDSVCHFMDVLAGYIIAGESETYPFEKDLFATNL